MTILDPCCEYEPSSIQHKTAEECSSGDFECRAPQDHHPYTRRVNLHRGEWTYVIEFDGWSDHGFVDATKDVIEAFRDARTLTGWKRAQRTHPRKGLAYGFIVDGPKGSVTIIPTPRYIR